ncbi:MAG: hypothetical protein MJ057_09235 [Sphaerochaetaceae bacterium]|nr:hypothetical protein [Sphaerochaetaceae bacterium]
MKRVSEVLITAILAFVLALSLVSCATSKAKDPEDDAFVKQFKDLGAFYALREGNIALQSDVVLPAGSSIVLNSNEVWVINLNGHSIRQTLSNGKPAVEVLKGTLGIVNGVEEKSHGGIYCEDGVAVLVKKGATLQVDNGTISGKDYAIEVNSGAVLRINGGRIQADVLPMLVHDGWGGHLTGGLYSAYDAAYDQAILGKSYACIRFAASDADFKDAYSGAFTISNRTDYTGVAGLKLSTTGGLLARFRLYKTHETDALLMEYDPMPVFEWAMYPGQVQEVYFEAGSYVLKVAEGYDWRPETGFGAEGSYWCMDPFTFADGYVYIITTQPGKTRHIPDTLEGFLTGSF